MKKIVTIIALAASFAAQAGVIATAPNQSGGKIRLMDTPCELGTYPTNKDWRHVSSNAQTGSTTTGCWMLSQTDDSLVILWRDKTISTFNAGDFNRTAYGMSLTGGQ